MTPASLVAVMLVYWPTLPYGFYYDDYHFVHPYSRVDLWHVLHASWDSTGIEVAFYRPITIWFFAARFAVFGLNANAYHATSLALFAVAAALLGVFAAAAFGRLSAGLLTSLAFVVHPAMPYSAVAWVTNQMHLLELVVVLAAMTWWFYVRHSRAGWWLPLVAMQVMAIMIKEDGVMLLPTIIALHALRRQFVERTLRWTPPVAFLVASLVSIGALLTLRQSFLHGIGGYHLPPLARGWSNLTRAPIGIFRLVPAKRPYQELASWFVTALPVVAILLWRRVSPQARFGIAAGLAIAILFDLPFVFVVKPEQVHLVATGAALFLAACAVAVMDAMPRACAKAAVALCVLAGLGTMALVARDIARDFDPFGSIVLRNDRIVMEWAAVPAELRAYLAAKQAPDAKDRLSSSPAEAVEVVGFGLHGVETNREGTSYRWMSASQADIYVRRDARLVTIPLRHEIGAFREPARAVIIADGQELDRVVLTDGTWRQSAISLRPNKVSRLSRMHRIQIVIGHAWVPATVIPQSTDTRTLGLQVGTIIVR